MHREPVPATDDRIRTCVENLVFALGDAAGADRASLFVVDEDRGLLRLAVAKTEHGRPLAVQLPLGQGVAGLAWELGEPVRVDDAYACARFHRDVDAVSGYRTRSLLCVPVHRAGRVAAIVELLNPVGREVFTADDERALRAHAPELAALIGACDARGWTHPGSRPPRAA
jgi:GAF domain-containing protein